MVEITFSIEVKCAKNYFNPAAKNVAKKAWLEKYKPVMAHIEQTTGRVVEYLTRPVCKVIHRRWVDKTVDGVTRKVEDDVVTYWMDAVTGSLYSTVDHRCLSSSFLRFKSVIPDSAIAAKAHLLNISVKGSEKGNE